MDENDVIDPIVDVGENGGLDPNDVDLEDEWEEEPLPNKAYVFVLKPDMALKEGIVANWRSDPTEAEAAPAPNLLLEGSDVFDIAEALSKSAPNLDISPFSSGNILKNNFSWSGRNNKGNRKNLTPGRGRAAVGDPVDPALTLASVGGLSEHVAYLKRAVIFPLQNKDAFKQWGIDPPRGILFHGPPGTGKTLLAKALVNDLKVALGGQDVTFFYQKGCDSCSTFFGETEETLRRLFDQAQKNTPSVIFFDEIDGLCPDRGRAGQSSEAYVGVVSALLGLIDSVKRGEIFIIGATNRLDMVDAAIRRPGRFDKHLAFPLPDYDARSRIIEIHTSKWHKLRPAGELLASLAAQTNGFTGSDLKNLCHGTVDAASARMGREVRAQDIVIEPEDWVTSIKNTNISSSNVFGSTILTTQPMLPSLLPLLRGTVQDVLDTLVEFLPNEPYKVIGNRPLIVWEKDVRSELTLHSLIMQEVLSNPNVNNTPAYILSMESILKKQMNGFSLIEAVEGIVNQGVVSEKQCILYVPGIDELFHNIVESGGDGHGSIFLETLGSLGGSKCLLLVTCIGPAQDRPQELKKLLAGYDNQVIVGKPSAEDRTAFFSQIFDNLIEKDVRPIAAKVKKTSEDSTPTDPRFKVHLNKAVSLTVDDPCESVCKLYSALKSEVENWTTQAMGESGGRDGDAPVEEINFQELDKAFVKILDLYSLHGNGM